MSSTVRETEPLQHGLPGHGWTVKKIVCLCEQLFGLGISRTTFYRYLGQNRLSWKKCQKVLGRANAQQRAHYMQEFQELFAQVCNDEVRLLYLDESHFHRDLQVGYTWAATGETAWRKSDCPPLSDRINCYGAYDFSAGRCFIWQDGPCNQQQTVTFLHQLTAWLNESAIPVVLVWDGAPWHRAVSVRQAAAALDLTIKQLPGYSPDLNPIEGLWKWLRSEVTQHHCYPTVGKLYDACQAFIQRINMQPLQLVDRLWPKLELDPDYEKLLMSI